MKLDRWLFAVGRLQMRWFRNWLFVLCILIPAEVAAYPRCNNVREVDFRNLVYPLSDDVTGGKTKRLRTVRGEYRQHFGPGGGGLYLHVTDIVFGDLTGDGTEEAAVAAQFGVPANFYTGDTYIFGCASGKLKLIGILKQKRIAKETGMSVHEPVNHPIRIDDGELLVTHGTEGSHGGPTFRTTFRYRIVQGKLVPHGRPVRRKIRYPWN